MSLQLEGLLNLPFEAFHFSQCYKFFDSEGVKDPALRFSIHNLSIILFHASPVISFSSFQPREQLNCCMTIAADS